MTPSAVADLIRRLGYQAQLTVDEPDGQAIIMSAASGVNFAILFHPSQEGDRSDCDFNSFTFSALFPTRKGWGTITVNDLAERVRFLRPYLNNAGELIAEWDVYIGSELLTDMLFARHYKLWEAGVTRLPSQMNKGM